MVEDQEALIKKMDERLRAVAKAQVLLITILIQVHGCVLALQPAHERDSISKEFMKQIEDTLKEMNK